MKEIEVFIPNPLTIQLASDADLNRIWENCIADGESSLPPRRRISVKEALLSQTKLQSGNQQPTPFSNN
jgi:hypothetical protein